MLTSAWSGLYFAGGKNPAACDLRKFLEKAGLIVTTAYGTASFAIKVGYSVLAAGVVVFVAVLALTLYP